SAPTSSVVFSDSLTAMGSSSLVAHCGRLGRRSVDVDREVAGGEMAVGELAHRRLLAGAQVLGPRTAGAKAAPAGRVDRRRRLPPDRPGHGLARGRRIGAG